MIPIKKERCFMVWINGRKMNEEEYAEYRRQEEAKEERLRQEVAARIRRLSEEYEALNRLMEAHPRIGFAMSTGEERGEHIYEQMRKNLLRANGAPRCNWIREDGTACRSPKMRDHIYCYAHRQMMEARADRLTLPAPEDGNGVLLAIMRVQQALIDERISERKAGLLLYSLQLAVTNMKQTTFGKAADHEMVTEVVDEEVSLRNMKNEDAAVISADRRAGREPDLLEAALFEDTGGAGAMPPLPALRGELGAGGKAVEVYANPG